jgi:hypothetical protein
MDLQTSTVAAPSGGYAFAVSGVEIAKMFPLALGGVLNIDSPDTISGNGSVSDEILDFKVTSSVAVSGTLAAPDSFGQFTINLTGGFSPKNPAAKIQFTGYIVDNTHIKLIESDSSENDGTAQLNANPAAMPASLSGFADINLGFGANPDQPFTGSFSAPASNGLFPGTLVGTNNNILSSVVFTPQIAVDYYIIDPGHGFFIETDLVTQGAPQNGQLSLGYYAERTPVCDGCP